MFFPNNKTNINTGYGRQHTKQEISKLEVGMN